MRLSEAIRLGAMLKPQTTGGYVRDGGGTCALTAAAEAVGLRHAPFLDGVLQVDYPSLARVFPVLNARVGWFPVTTDMQPDDVRTAIWDLNDAHGWTREQIADWVETIEQQQPATVETPAEVTA